MNIIVYQVDYEDPKHAADLINLLDYYAQTLEGGAKALSDSVKQTLVKNLSVLSNAVSLLAYDDDKPIGLLNAFGSFSTFANEPLVNIHDIVVLEDYRNQGVARQLLAVMEELAKAQGCCKLTLEVLDGNNAAKHCYQDFGFGDFVLDPTMGKALFWQKSLR